MARNYKNIKKIFADDPSMLAILEQRESNEILRDLVGKQISLEGIHTIKGDPGYTPIKGTDYLTDEEVADIKDELTPEKGVDYLTPEELQAIKTEATPIKGVHYFDGKDANEADIVRRISKIVPTKEDILSSIELPKPINEDELIARVLDEIPEVEVPTIAEIIKEIKKKKLIELTDIKGARLDMNDQRWHGSGTAGTVTTTYSQTPVGLIDGINTTYTTSHSITTVINLAINGQYIHPSEYTVSGAGFTMLVPLDASLSGLGFTIVYV